LARVFNPVRQGTVEYHKASTRLALIASATGVVAMNKRHYMFGVAAIRTADFSSSAHILKSDFIPAGVFTPVFVPACVFSQDRKQKDRPKQNHTCRQDHSKQEQVGV
jgi:hypothetical protein